MTRDEPDLPGTDQSVPRSTFLAYVARDSVQVIAHDRDQRPFSRACGPRSLAVSPCSNLHLSEPHQNSQFPKAHFWHTSHVHWPPSATDNRTAQFPEHIPACIRMTFVSTCATHQQPSTNSSRAAKTSHDHVQTWGIVKGGVATQPGRVAHIGGRGI